MPYFKTAQTNVTYAQLTAEQGGTNDNDDTKLWVECPWDYDADDITADDILNDAMVTLVSEPDPSDQPRDFETREEAAVVLMNSQFIDWDWSGTNLTDPNNPTQLADGRWDELARYCYANSDEHTSLRFLVACWLADHGNDIINMDLPMPVCVLHADMIEHHKYCAPGSECNLWQDFVSECHEKFGRHPADCYGMIAEWSWAQGWINKMEQGYCE